MDLIPKPDQVVSAAGNVASSVFRGGLADLRPMPRTLIDAGRLRQVYHYRPAARVTETGDPVLLVTPLAAPSLCFDLRRGCSLVEHLVDIGRPTYLVEYGEVSFRNRSLGMEHWIDEVMPTAIRKVSDHAGGRPVHVVGWSLGGIFAMLTAADNVDLPIASLTVVGSPVDTAQVPLIAPLRPLLNWSKGGGAVTQGYRILGGAPKPLVRWAFQLSSGQKLITKPLVKMQNLDDREFLAQIEAVDNFTDHMIAYPGRSFGQLYHRMIKGNMLKHGTMEFDDRTIDLRKVKVPTLVFGGANDSIAPIPSVKRIMDLLEGSEEARFEIVPGGHLGMLTGRAARGTTWTILDEWFQQWSGRTPKRTKPKAAKKAAAKSTAKKKPAKKAATTPTSTEDAAKKSATRKSTRKVAVRKVAKKAGGPSKPLGANPDRRYDSGPSRNLAN